MANRTQLTVAEITNFQGKLKTQRDQFDTIEKEMNRILHGGFLWEDLIAQKFRQKYENGLQRLRSELLPAIERYEQFLQGLAERTRIYEQDN